MQYLKYFSIAVFTVFSINCTAVVKDNQTNAVPQNTTNSGTASEFSNNETSETQTDAPEAVVKELYKLHNADKSPLYKAKERAAIEKFFAKDFVNLVWTGGNEPNLMNKLAIEGDALTGLDSLSKFESESLGKAQVNGAKVIVPVTINASDEENKKFKKLLNYELVKESAGWRISDIKTEVFYTGSLVGTIKNLKNNKVDAKTDAEFTIIRPPFVGTRWFVIDRSVEGTGTPKYYLTINSENYMFCGFVQINQADGTETKEEVPLGRFKQIFDCNFKNDSGVSGKYKVEGNYIYKIDKNNQIVKADECCPVGSDSEECECKGEFTK